MGQRHALTVSLHSRVSILSATLSPLTQHADSSSIKENSILQQVDCDYHICLTATTQSFLVDRGAVPALDTLAALLA